MTIIAIARWWYEDAERAADLARFAQTCDRRRLVRGLVVERAVIDYLTRIKDAKGDRFAATWLSAIPRSSEQRAEPWEVPGHAGDIRWHGHELDVKLIARGHRELVIKTGAAHLPHLFTEWHRPGELVRVLGVLLPNQPEFAHPPVVLRDRHGQQFTRLNDHHRSVTGWYVPRARLQPVEVLLT